METTEAKVKGKPFTLLAKQLYNTIKARDIARFAKPFIQAEVKTASKKVAALVKDKAIDKDTHAVYVDERALQYPVSVKGNRKPAPISSNLLLTFLDKGTPPHVIKHLNPAFALHFMYKGAEVFTKKPINHPGTKAQNVWGMSDALYKKLNDFTAAKFAAVMR